MNMSLHARHTNPLVLGGNIEKYDEDDEFSCDICDTSLISFIYIMKMFLKINNKNPKIQKIASCCTEREEKKTNPLSLFNLTSHT